MERVFISMAEAAASASGAAKVALMYAMVEPKLYLYVSVVRARDLVDITGMLGLYVEVKVGNLKGMTTHMEANSNPVWRQVFAFSGDHIHSNQLEITIMDKDVLNLKDDFVVGRVLFDISGDIPSRLPPDNTLAPQWYNLSDRFGEKLRHGEIMLSVWLGTQADEAFQEAWHSDAHSLSHDGIIDTSGSKVYYSPKLTYLKVVAISAQDLVLAEGGRTLAKIQLGGQIYRTQPAQKQGSTNPTWNEEFMFVSGEPFKDSLMVTVEEEHVAHGHDEPAGRVIIPVAAPYVTRNDLAKSVVPSKSFSMWRRVTVNEAAADADVTDDKEWRASESKIQLRLSLETAYHVLDEPTFAGKTAIGIVDVGILSACNLVVTKAKEGRLADPYCVIKYGEKWVRTRTLLNTAAPHWNEQHSWEVFDNYTVATVAVFDSDAKDQRIGKVRIRLAMLETDQVYTHRYPLMALTPSGRKKTGELYLTFRFTCAARVNMPAKYGDPVLPKMAISVQQVDCLRVQAMQMVARRLERAEPPLRREVVEYMLEVDRHMFSLRWSNANYYWITLINGVVAVGRGLDDICKWKVPLVTHAQLLLLVCHPKLTQFMLTQFMMAMLMVGISVLPKRMVDQPRVARVLTFLGLLLLEALLLVLMSVLPSVPDLQATLCLLLFVIMHLNWRRLPPHMDMDMDMDAVSSLLELYDELHTFLTSRPEDLVPPPRYDRLRSVARKAQAAVATQVERAVSLICSDDFMAKAMVMMTPMALYCALLVMPPRGNAMVVGLYRLRHPRYQAKSEYVLFMSLFWLLLFVFCFGERLALRCPGAELELRMHMQLKFSSNTILN